MPKPDPYCDAVLGDWKYSAKESKVQKKFVFTRRAQFALHKDHALDYLNPETLKKQKVHGEVILTESKLIDKNSSAVSMFRGLELTEKSVLVDVLP